MTITPTLSNQQDPIATPLPPQSFWDKHKQDIVLIACCVGTAAAVATVACLLFIPGGQLFGLGGLLMAAFAGTMIGSGALATAILLPTAFGIVGIAGTALAVRYIQDYLNE